jgi:hypothetical protein
MLMTIATARTPSARQLARVLGALTIMREGLSLGMTPNGAYTEPGVKMGNHLIPIDVEALIRLAAPLANEPGPQPALEYDFDPALLGGILMAPGTDDGLLVEQIQAGSIKIWLKEKIRSIEDKLRNLLVQVPPPIPPIEGPPLISFVRQAVAFTPTDRASVARAGLVFAGSMELRGALRDLAATGVTVT